MSAWARAGISDKTHAPAKRQIVSHRQQSGRRPRVFLQGQEGDSLVFIIITFKLLEYQTASCQNRPVCQPANRMTRLALYPMSVGTCCSRTPDQPPTRTQAARLLEFLKCHPALAGKLDKGEMRPAARKCDRLIYKLPSDGQNRSAPHSALSFLVAVSAS
jgi:hypothetical protein